MNQILGAFIRSKVARIQRKKIQLFFNLEKKRGKSKKIFSLNIEGNLVTDKARVSNFVYTFYSQLYSSSFKPQFAERFFIFFLFFFLRGFKHSHLL